MQNVFLRLCLGCLNGEVLPINQNLLSRILVRNTQITREMFLISNQSSTKGYSPAIHTKKYNNKKYRMIERILIPILTLEN